MPIKSCPACGYTNVIDLYDADQTCVDCGHVFITPPLRDEFLRDEIWYRGLDTLLAAGLTKKEFENSKTRELIELAETALKMYHTLVFEINTHLDEITR